MEYLCLIYDGSFDGFLSVVFYCFEKKILPANIISTLQQQQSFLVQSLYVQTEEEKAERVWVGLQRILQSSSANKLFKAFLAKEHLMEMHLFNCIKFIFDEKRDPLQNFSNSSVLMIEKYNKRVNQEIHRMHAFVRFKRTKDDIYFAVIEPDFDILSLVAGFFEKRYADQQWLIYDLKRSYGIFYDLTVTSTVQIESFQEKNNHSNYSNNLEIKEEIYESLWRSYFNAVNIAERKNTKLQLKHMPKRYWKYLSELKK